MQAWGVGETDGCIGNRSRFGSLDDRQYGGQGTPARCRCPKKAGDQALGRSRGGLSTKIHATVDALGNPLRCLLSGGHVADITHGQALIEGFAAQALLADQGYDANHLLDYLAERDIEAVIPPKANRLEQREYDRHVYKDRNLVERFFNRIKQFRRIATRYGKLARNFFAMLNLVCAYIWLA